MRQRRLTQTIVEILQHIKQHPDKFFSDDMSAVDNFVSGFSFAKDLLTDNKSFKGEFDRLKQEYGLTGNLSIYQQLVQQNYSHDEAVQAYFGILIQAYQFEKFPLLNETSEYWEVKLDNAVVNRYIIDYALSLEIAQDTHNFTVVIESDFVFIHDSNKHTVNPENVKTLVSILPKVRPKTLDLSMGM